MHSHVSIELLKTFTNDELSLFGDFVRSPFFNKREVVIRLFDLISKYAPDYSSPALKKENIYKKLFPGKEYNEQTLRSRMSEFSSLIKEFLIEVRFSKDLLMKKKYYINQLLERKKFDLCEKQIREGLESIEKNEKYDQDILMEKLRLYELYTKVLNAKDLKPESLKLSYKISELSIDYFLIDILKTNINIICDEIETKQKGDSTLLKEFFKKFDLEGYINVLKEKNDKNYPLIAISYYANKSMLEPENENYFYEMKKLLYKFFDKFTYEELYNYWTLLSNSALMNYLSKGEKFLHEGHEINKFFIEKKLYDEAKPFSPLGYQNTMTNALLVNDLDWADEFVDNFKNKLPAEVVNNRYNYCKAVICFERKKFGESIEYLSRVDHIDWGLKINVRLYYLQNYYELGMSEQVISLIDSFRHFSSNNPNVTPEYMDEKVKNTIRFISKMSNAKFGGRKLDYADLKEAEVSKNILYKKWIIEKMKELI